MTAAVFVRMISVYGERHRMPFAVAGLSRTLTNVFVLSIGFLMLLRIFEVEITPILTALGVGGLAVASGPAGYAGELVCRHPHPD